MNLDIPVVLKGLSRAAMPAIGMESAASGGVPERKCESSVQSLIRLPPGLQQQRSITLASPRHSQSTVTEREGYQPRLLENSALHDVGVAGEATVPTTALPDNKLVWQHNAIGLLLCDIHIS